jgi:hypothetical protein
MTLLGPTTTLQNDPVPITAVLVLRFVVVVVVIVVATLGLDGVGRAAVVSVDHTSCH